MYVCWNVILGVVPESDNRTKLEVSGVNVDGIITSVEKTWPFKRIKEKLT